MNYGHGAKSDGKLKTGLITSKIYAILQVCSKFYLPDGNCFDTSNVLIHWKYLLNGVTERLTKTINLFNKD